MQPYGCLKNTSLIILVKIQRVCNPPATEKILVIKYYYKDVMCKVVEWGCEQTEQKK